MLAVGDQLTTIIEKGGLKIGAKNPIRTTNSTEITIPRTTHAKGGIRYRNARFE